MYFTDALEAMIDGNVVQRKGYFPLLYEDGKIKRKYEGKLVEIDELSVESILSHEWEIVEDIQKIKLFRSKDIYFICPKCHRYQEQLVLSLIHI